MFRKSMIMFNKNNFFYKMSILETVNNLKQILIFLYLVIKITKVKPFLQYLFKKF